MDTAGTGIEMSDDDGAYVVNLDNDYELMLIEVDDGAVIDYLTRCGGAKNSYSD